MKAYILKLSFEDITPLIWRRIILPAGATFNRLHETIQNVKNFQSWLSPYHSFGVEIDDYFITSKRRMWVKQLNNPSVLKSMRFLKSIVILHITTTLETTGGFRCHLKKS